MRKHDFLVAFGVFRLGFVSMFPAVIPLIVMRNLGPAPRISNGIAILLLFLTGYAYGKSIERQPWLTGISMVVLGAALAGPTIALGG